MATVTYNVNIETTYENLKSLITGSTLSPGSTYKITGFNKNRLSGSTDNPFGHLPEILYDDGNDLGITIYMQAISTSEISDAGFGEFYNPKYITDPNSYLNNDGSGLMGIWDGDNPDLSAIPIYTIGQVVYWGGYAWENISGNTGSSVDAFELDGTDWLKLPYSNVTHYNKIIDEIKVDWTNGILIERYNADNQILAKYDPSQYSWWINETQLYLKYNPIVGIPFGLYSDVLFAETNNYFLGISNLKIVNSRCELINFKGDLAINISLDHSYLYDNYFGLQTRLNAIELDSFCYFQNNSLNSGSTIESCKLYSSCDIYGNFLTASTMNRLFMNESCNINQNIFLNNNLYNNILNFESSIYSNNASNSNISYNNINNSSQIYNNILQNSSNIVENFIDNHSKIAENNLTSSQINQNYLKSFSEITYNQFSSVFCNFNHCQNASLISYNIFDGSNISENTLKNSCNINYNTGITTSHIYRNELNDSVISFNYNRTYSLIASNILAASSISYNQLLDSEILYNKIMPESSIDQCLLDTSDIVRNYLENSDLNTNSSGILTGKIIQNNYCENATVVGDFTSSTYIYDSQTKKIFTREGGVSKLGFYDTSNNFVVFDVNA